MVEGGAMNYKDSIPAIDVLRSLILLEPNLLPLPAQKLIRLLYYPTKKFPIDRKKF